MNDGIVFVLTSVMVGERFKDKRRVLCGFICSKQNILFGGLCMGHSNAGRHL